MSLFPSDTEFGVIAPVTAAVNQLDPTFRSSVVDRHLRALLRRDFDGTFRNGDYLNAVEVVQSMFTGAAELLATMVVANASERLGKGDLSFEQKTRWLKDMTRVQYETLRAEIISRTHPLHLETACERASGQIARDATIVHREASLRNHCRRKAALRAHHIVFEDQSPKDVVLSVVRFIGKGTLNSLDAQLCTTVPAAIEQYRRRSGRYEFVADQRGRYTVHVYHPDHVATARSVITRAGFKNVE